ncbi:hypothetical protein GCM10010909_16760 [Acidocella aquatica]|uniref:HTH tetR-type domain-containing protein n=1 Tax=Acidocella aquatica TaxID=1922313 RepID=A0ABQ6AAA0_9PROT|nr:hypothetical protein GCM10010909_16760 [Acidocella aquatica]
MREAQRALTRSRIVEAAREVFFLRGYRNATMEEIAEAAGASRSTLYANFKDKDVILAEVADSYMLALCEVAERLPGPDPTRVEIDVWLREIAAFIARDRTPSVLLSGLASAEDAPPVIHHIGEKLIETLAVRLPPFRLALAESLARAWATVILREIGWACQQFSRSGVGGPGPNLLIVAGDLLERFIQEK